MNNQNAGFIILGITLLIGFIIFSFNRALTQMVTVSCSHGSACPMWTTLAWQTNISIGIMVFVALVGVYLIIYGKQKTTYHKNKQISKPALDKDNYQEIIKELNPEEKKIFEAIINEQGTIFQSKLVEETSFTKVKVTRILDRLEGQGLLERKRRGMTNIVILNHSRN